MECWEDGITNSPGWESYCYYYYYFSITVTDGVLSSVAVLVAVVCCKAALPSGHFAITMLSLCLKSKEHPHEILSIDLSIYVSIKIDFKHVRYSVYTFKNIISNDKLI